MSARCLRIRLIGVLIGVLVASVLLAPSRGPCASYQASANAVSVEYNLSFPLIVDENASLQLAEALASALSLGSVISSNTTATSQSNHVGDGLNNTLWNLPSSQVFGEDVIAVPTSAGTMVSLYYSTPAYNPGVVEGNGTFAFGEISNFSASTFVPGPLNSSKSVTALTMIAGVLRIPLNGTEQVQTYVEGPWIITTLYRSLHGHIVEFGNQLQLITSLSGAGGTLRLFPWIEGAPAPVITEDGAFASALHSINATFRPTNGTFGKPVTNFFLDTIHDSFGYSFRVSYNETDFAANGASLFVVWVDGITGMAVRIQEINILPGTSASPLAPWAFLVRWPGVLIPAVATLGGALYLLFLFEAFRVGFLYALGLPFFRLRRENALEHFTRGRIFEAVRSTPGMTFSEVRDGLGLSNGVAAYHLVVLEKMGLTISRRDGRLRHYFCYDAPEKVVQEHLSPLQYAILDVLANTFTRPAQLARELNTSRQRVAYNLKRLRKAGFIALDAEAGEMKLTHAGAEALTYARTNADASIRTPAGVPPR